MFRLWRQEEVAENPGWSVRLLYIDEINTADIEFIRESAMRCDYLMGTLNPDVPNLPVYKEYINCSRPPSEWEEETPKEILEELSGEPIPGCWILGTD